MCRVDELVRDGKYPDPQRYYEFLHNKINLKFVPRYPDQTIKEQFACTLSKTMKYEQITTTVAAHLGVQPTHLRFTPTTNDGRPRQYALKRAGPVSPILQMTASGGMPLPPIVFYEVLELSLADVESRREITVTWLPEGVNVLVISTLPQKTLSPAQLVLHRRALSLILTRFVLRNRNP
jgi:ubiquitin carboxyl-terminal hydrolase 7